MTVPSTTRRAGPYPGNGVATSFPFSFKVYAKADISVVFANSLGVESTLVLDSDYSVTLNADQNANPGGTVIYPIIGSPMPSTQALAVVGGLDYAQTTALPNGGAYNASIVERALDRITILTQQLRETVNRGVQLAFTTAANVSSRLPAPRGGSVLGWAADGLSIANYDAGSLGVSVTYANWRTKTFNGTGAQVAFVLDTDAGIASNCDVVVGGVAQTPDINFSYDSISKTLTFLTGAPPVGTNNVVVRYGQALPQGSMTSAGITDATTAGRAVLTAATAAAQRTALGLGTTDSPTFAGINGGQVAGLRNRLINGAQAIDQEFSGASTAFTAGAALKYAIDQWYGYCTGANVNGQRVAGTAPNQFNYQFTGAAGVTKIGYGQRMEAANTQDLAGTTTTFSVDLANSLLTTVAWTAWRANTADTFGTLASPTRTQIGTGTFTVSGTLARYSAQIAVPAAATTGIEIEFSVGAQISGTWTIGRAQFEGGSVATSFEVRPPSLELTLCQWFARRVRVTMATSGFIQDYQFGEMRTTPAATFLSGITFTGGSFVATTPYSGRQNSYASVAGDGICLLTCRL